MASLLVLLSVTHRDSSATCLNPTVDSQSLTHLCLHLSIRLHHRELLCLLSNQPEFPPLPSTELPNKFLYNLFSPSWCQLLGPTYKPLILQTDRGQQVTRVTANCSCSQLISSVSHAASGLIGDAVYTLLWTGGNVRL